MPKWMNWLPHQWYASTLALPIVILAYPSLRCGDAYELLLDRELSAQDQFYAGWGTVIRMDLDRLELGVQRFECMVEPREVHPENRCECGDARRNSNVDVSLEGF